MFELLVADPGYAAAAPWPGGQRRLFSIRNSDINSLENPGCRAIRCRSFRRAKSPLEVSAVETDPAAVKSPDLFSRLSLFDARAQNGFTRRG